MSAEPITLENMPARLDKLAALMVKIRTERDELLEIVTILAEKLPDGCECDGEYIDGVPVGKQCLPCRASAFLDTL